MLDQVQTAIQTFLGANWSTTPVAFENDGFVPPTDANGSVLPWVYCEVSGGLFEQVSIGAGAAAADLWMSSGVLWLHVFVGATTGSLLAKQLGSQLATLFQGLSLAPNIAFGDINMAATGGSQDGSDWSLSVSIDWKQG